MVHPGLPSKVCGVCGDKFDDKVILDEHMTSVHQGVKITRRGIKSRKPKMAPKRSVCDLCGSSVKGSLKTHKAMVHCKTDPQNCPHCGKGFKSPVHLSHHIRNMHEKYPCDLCGKMIATKHKSRHFQQVHVDPEHRRYKCEHCGKGFAASQSLKDHVNLHTGERPHVCKFCGKSFADYGIRPTYC